MINTRNCNRLISPIYLLLILLGLPMLLLIITSAQASAKQLAASSGQSGLLQYQAPAAPLFAAGACDTVVGIPVIECDALVKLYDSTQGSQWISSTNWLNMAAPCSWYGVGCTAGQVTSLVLPVNGLTGSIPPELGNLAALRDLRLYTNQLNGSIPPELGQLTNLEMLHFYANSLTGTIPVSLQNLRNLKELSLYGNQLSGSIPPELGQLTNLELLSLYTNQLTGPIPATLHNLRNLQYLYLHENQLSGSIPGGLGTLTALRDLHLYSNQLSGSIPSGLGNLTELRDLRLHLNQLSGSIPHELGRLTNLEILNLYDNQLSGVLTDTLVSSLSHLKQLGLAVNQLSGNLPLNWNLPDLEILNLYDNRFTGPIPASLQNSPNLQYLHLYKNQLEGPIPDALGTLKQLKELVLYNNDLLSPTSCEFTKVGNDIISSQPLSFTLNLDFNRLANVPQCVSEFLSKHDPNDPNDPNDLDWASTQRSPVYVEVRNQNGSPAEAEVYIIRNNQVLTSTTTDTNGFAFANTSAGAMRMLTSTDELLVMAPLATPNSAKLNRSTDTDWAYKLFATNRITAPDGVNIPLINHWGKYTVTLPGSSPLILFNLVVSVERQLYDQSTFNSGQTPAYLTTLTAAFRQASNFLYEATDGKFALGQVTIYEGGRQWQEADIHFLTTNDFTPVATVRGMWQDVAHVDLGLHWDRKRGQTAWDQSDGFRTIVHELGHYLFNLFDSYLDEQASGRYNCITIMSWPYAGSPEGMSATAYDVPIFSMRDLPLWSRAACGLTDQFKNNHQSDWETIQTVFTDTLRTVFTGTQQVLIPTVHLPGPKMLPNYPKITIQPPGPGVVLPKELAERSVTIPVKDGQGTYLYGTQVYIQRNDPARFIKVGAPGAGGQIQLPDVQAGDRILVLSAGGELQGSVEIPSIGPIPTPVVQPAVVNPTTNHTPIPDWGGLKFVIAATDLVTIQGMLTDAGGNLIPAVNWSRSGDNFEGTFNFGGQKIKSGYIYITAQTATGKEFEFITNFSAADLPTSDIREHVPTVLASFDGNFQLEIPTDTLPIDLRDHIIAMVMPVQGVKPVTNAVEAAAVAEAGNNLPLPTDLQLVGSLYNVRASHSITKTPKAMQLTLYYSDETARRYENSALTIYYRNETTRKWEPQDSAFLNNSRYGQAVTTQIDRFGIYALMVKTIWPLSPGQNAVISPLTFRIPVTTALADCNGKYEAVYYQTGVKYPGDAWQKYVAYVPNDPVVPAYINDLVNFEPGQTYQIIIKPGESCTIDFSKILPASMLARSAARSFIRVAGELPTLPVGFYGVVPSNTTKIEILSAAGDYHEVTKTVSLASDQLAYTADVDVNNKTEQQFTITVKGSDGQVLSGVQASGMAGVTKRQDFALPLHVLFLPLVTRSTGTE